MLCIILTPFENKWLLYISYGYLVVNIVVSLLLNMERNYRDTKFIITGLIAIIICNFANNNLQIFIPLSLQGYRHYNYEISQLRVFVFGIEKENLHTEFCLCS